MKSLDCFDASSAGCVTQKQGADQIPKDREENASDQQSQLERFSLQAKIADEEGGHDGGLETANSTACFIHSDRAIGELDQTAGSLSWHPEQVEDFDVD